MSVEGAGWTHLIVCVFYMCSTCVCVYSWCQCLCGYQACLVFNRQFLLGCTAGHQTPLYRVFAITEPVASLLCQQEAQIMSLSGRLQQTEEEEEKIRLTFVVGPSSFSATQLCRLNERSLQFTRTRLPNFSSNCFTSGSIPEKSSFWKTRQWYSVSLWCVRLDQLGISELRCTLC